MATTAWHQWLLDHMGSEASDTEADAMAELMAERGVLGPDDMTDECRATLSFFKLIARAKRKAA